MNLLRLRIPGPGQRRTVRRRLAPATGAAFGALLLVLCLGALAAPAQEAAAPPVPEQGPTAPALGGNRAPFKMRFSPDGSRLYVVEMAEGTVAVIDPAAGRVLNRFPTGGEQPTGLSLNADGSLLAVANSTGDSVALLDPRSGALVKKIPLRGMPYDLLFTADGKTLCVAVSSLNEVALLDMPGGEVAARIAVGAHPRALALAPNGQLVCANTTSGDVSLLDLAAKREARRIRTPIVNLRGVAVRPDGRLIYVTGQRAQNERPTETAVGVWSNQVLALSSRGGVADNIWLDLLGDAASDPDDIVLSADGRRAFVACAGGHNIQSIQVGGNDYDPKVVRSVGAVPRGLVLSPDGRQLWVSNSLGNNLTVLDTGSLEVVRRVELGPASRRDPHLLGEYLFRTATITKGGQFSCNSCHTEGGVDGISWKFVHVNDGLAKELRNVRTLRGPLQETGPFRWTGHATSVKEFIKEEVTGLLQSPPLTEQQVAALAGFITSQPIPRNPHRNEDNSLTAAAVRGQTLFAGKAGCAACHSGPNQGGQQRKAWIGTTPEGVELDVPHLAEVYDTAPYLHDGRAATFEEIFDRHDPQARHGNAGTLTVEERADLLRFLREL